MNDGTLRATVTAINEANIMALARLLAQGNGSFMIKVHQKRIVSIAKIARPEMIEAGPAMVEVIIRDDSPAP